MIHNRLYDNLVQQFKGKPKIEKLLDAFWSELEELHEVFDQLQEMRSLGKAQGKQLDGIGDIVVLSRPEAGLLAGQGDEIPFPVIDDERYRKFLRYKILKNTSICTYYDMVTAIEMIWEMKPIRFYENLDGPATVTMAFLYDSSEKELEPVPPIKAAGVGIKILAETNVICKSGKVAVGAFPETVFQVTTGLKSIHSAVIPVGVRLIPVAATFLQLTIRERR